MRKNIVVTVGLLAAGVALLGVQPAGADTTGPIDLGTLPGGTESKAVDISETGVIVGEATTAGGQTHAVRWGADHAIRQLGTLAGSTWSTAVDVNDAGTVVVGVAQLSGQRRPVRWDANGAITALPLLPGGARGEVVAVNASGVAVGHSFAADGRSHAVKWAADGTVTDLGVLPGGSYPPGEPVVSDRASSINDAGVVVGAVYTADAKEHAVRWDASGAISELGVPGGGRARAQFVNGAGDVVGSFQTTAGPTVPVRWTGAGTSALSMAGRNFYELVGLNETGVVAGNAGVGRQLYLGLSWDAAGQLTELPPLAGDVSSRAVDVTEDGSVVGNSSSAGETDRPVRWTGDVAQQLGAPAGATSASVVGANDGGAVVGLAILPGFVAHAVLWPAS
ncbi:hypothetical protein [Saccharothrix deserti]|uniref:hypothetical protein n=1 Tax=Saccharothrix deserti TaxID=2593674 RepID=UPI00131A83FB|nr:hypothetical protein [Saccharothrix deserti]